MNKFKSWPQLALVAILSMSVAGAIGYFLSRSNKPKEAAILPSAARVERVDGKVGLKRGLNNNNTDTEWTEVTPNTPVSVGDRLYAHDNSRTGIAFTGRNFARLEPDSSLDVLSLSHGRTQLALRDGSAIFNIGEMGQDELFEVATPFGAIDLQEPGVYEVGMRPDGSSWISVLSGLAQVVGTAGNGQIGKGEMLSLLSQAATNYVMSRLSPDYAGGLLNDYYSYQYPDLYDGRYSDYNAYLSDPYYYDPANRYTSYRYVDDTIPGVWDLDQYGNWQNLNDYGYVWQPRVDAGWTPYQQGSWMMDDPYGLTWVSDEPWGYAPYHYGRWVNAGNQWYWVPDRINTQPAYSPALVAFIPLTSQNEIGWVPLAPGDSYAPVYYDANLQPHYLTQAPVVQQVINYNVPGAVTVVSADDFGRNINPKTLRKFDRQMLANVRPVLDPLSVGELRQLALQTINDRRRVDLPPGIAKKLDSTQVFTSAKPYAPPFRDDSTRGLHVEAVPEKMKKQKLQFKDERQAAQTPAQASAPLPNQKRKEETDVLAPKAARGDKEARRQLQEIQQQERVEQRAARQPVLIPQQNRGAAQAENGRVARGAEQRAQAERVGLNQRAQREAERQQSVAAQQQQQRAAIQQQAEAQRQAQRQAQQQRGQQQLRQRVEQPPREVRTPPGQMRQQQSPAQQSNGRGQSAPQPQPAKPQGQSPQGQGAQGKGKGKGHP
jgi:hypothetical protein